MKLEQKNPALEAEKKNPWYTDGQLPTVLKRQSRTIQRRYSFILDSVKSHMESHNGELVRILGVGCGDGVQLRLLTHIPEVELWGADYNPLRTGRANQNYPTAHMVCCDLLEFPFPASFFDIIGYNQVIGHIPQDDLLLEQFANVLEPRGLLILGTPNEGCFMVPLRNHIFEHRILKDTDYVHFYTELAIRGKLASVGFAIQQVMRENWSCPHQLIDNFLANSNWGVPPDDLAERGHSFAGSRLLFSVCERVVER
jgi:SAM-dependent methyltransferase